MSHLETPEAGAKEMSGKIRLNRGEDTVVILRNLETMVVEPDFGAIE